MGLLPYEKREKPEILVRKEEETNPNYGYIPEERPIEEYIKNGVINLDKPKGPTSHQVSDWVKKILHVKKAGHGGTLDPAVTGVLPIALDNATKIMRLFLLSGKEYVALMHLHSDIHEGKIRDAMKRFVGKIEQIPPKRSHVKRVKREREIYYIEFLEKKGRDVLFRVGAEKGTYIRRLCEQLGAMAGTRAHMVELRRTKAGGFNENERLVTLQDLEDAYAFWKEDGNEKFLRYCIQPMEVVTKLVPKVWVLDSTVDSLTHGAPLAAPGISKVEDGIRKGMEVAVMTSKNELVGIGIAQMRSQGMVEAEKGIAVKLDRVTMPIGVYPRQRPSKGEE
ncbi:MAG: RNA-guided pseudouridylation complex pseudouridine synthase subunit Cbf5 [Nanoarchaeota archaeon]|nr:RNA-guided pseudouridylation complex pseudouridine synthase subunit Cbf5 [Nanoarchaeota archaeon]